MPSLQGAVPSKLWQESPLLPQAPICRSIPLQPPASRTENVQFAFSLQQTGGAARLGTGGVAWQIDNGSAGSLQLSVFSLGDGSDGERAVANQHHLNHHPNPPSAQISLDFPTQIFPGVACVEHQQWGGALGTMVVGITATGIAFSVDLQRAMQLQGSAGNSAAGEQAFIRYANLSTLWPSVGSPSCIASADGHVLVGGALGPLLCLPFTWLQNPGPTTTCQPFELRESGWGIKSFIAGVLQRQQSPSAVAVSPLHSKGSRGGAAAAAAGGMIVVTYDDCKLRGFSLSRRTQLFTESLELSPAAAAARAVPVFSALHMDPPNQSPSSTDAQATGVLVVQLECRDALHRSLAAYHVAAVAGGHRLVVRQRTDLAAPAASSALSAAVCGSTIWMLLKVARGGTRLVGFDRSHGRMCATAALAEAGMLPHKLVMDPEGGDTMMMALWESSLAASISAAAPAEGTLDAESSPSGGPSSAELAAVAAHQVLARLLSAGGGLCRLSLRDALAYHGAQMTVVEAETVPLKRLSTYAHATVHAIQRRSPNVSPARCWLAFLGSYQEAWGRRHAPLCLLPPASSSSSAGQQLNPTTSSPLCLLRGSCMLAALRETAPVEALAMDASDLSASASSVGSGPNGTGLGGHGAKGGGGPAAAFEAKASSPSSASAAAALVAESVLPPPLHPVHRAARGLTRLLGPLSLDAFVSSLTPTPAPTSSHTATDSSSSARSRGALRAAGGNGTCVFEGGADAAAALAPAYATMVLEGPAGVAGGSKAGVGVGVGVGVTDDVSREQRVGWRQRRQKALLAAGQELGELPDLVGSIRAYCAYLTPQISHVEGGTSTMQGPPFHQSPAAATLVTVAARQLARAQMSAARDVLVLLGVLTQLGAVGSTPLTAQQLAELQGSVYGEVAVLLQQATLAFWLCSTHATAAAPAASTPQAPALEPALAFLCLGDSKEGGPRQLQQQQQQQLLLAPHGLAGRDVSLVARLLPSLASQLPTSTLALCCAAASACALVVALQQGGSEAMPTPPHITPSISSRERGGMQTRQAQGAHGATPLPVRVLQLGYQLFLANEHAPLMGLTRLAQAATASLPRSAIHAPAGTPGAATHQAQGPEFLHGLSLACRLGGAPHEERQKRVSQAAGCFFRAAASLDPAGRGAQALVHATVLRSLRQLLTGYPEHEDDQQEHAPFASVPASASYNMPSNLQAQQQRAFALLQVQLYEVVMMLFEREGAPEGAVIFARAALQHLPTAYGHHHPPAQQQQASGREQQPTAAAAAGAGPSGAVALGGQQGREITPQDEEETRRARGGLGVGPQGADGREGMAIDTEAPHGPSNAAGGGGGASRSESIGVKVGDGIWRRRRQQQLRVREARLWSNIFKYCCELGQWEDAYAALVCNPDPQRALECLRQLVKELSERGEVLTLCALPLASAVCMQSPEEEEQSGPQDSHVQGGMLIHAPAQGGGFSSLSTPVGPSGNQAQENHRSSMAGVVGIGVGRKRGRAGLEEHEGLLGSTATAPLVSLLQEVVAALQRRALNMDLTTQPQPYRLLYDFFVSRSDMRGAARAMVAYARRLRSEGPPGAATVAEALTAYELALNALALQDPDDAWLDVHSDPWLAAHTVPGATPPAFPLASAAGLDGGPGDVGADGPAGTSASAVGARVGVVAITHHALTLEYVLMRASAEVVATGASPGTDPLQAQRSPSDVLSQLLGVRAYDSAHRLTLCAWPEGGAQQMRALEALAGAMAREAARLQIQGESGGDIAGFLSGSPPSPQPEGAPSFSHPQQPQQQQPPIGGPSSNTHPAPASSSALPLPLLPPMSAVGLGAQDPGLVEGLWGQSLMGSRAAPAWAKLRALLATYAGTSGLGSALRCSAAAAILREDPRMHLPPWLLDMFQGAQKETGGSYEGMASAGCGPAELLDIYMAADRLEDAVAVVAEHVSRWSNTDPRLRRGRLAAAWFPHRRIRALRQRLRAAGADTSALDSAMAHHLEVLEHDAPVAQLPGPSGSNAGQLGLFGAPFEPAISFH